MASWPPPESVKGDGATVKTIVIGIFGNDDYRLALSHGIHISKMLDTQSRLKNYEKGKLALAIRTLELQSRTTHTAVHIPLLIELKG